MREREDGREDACPEIRHRPLGSFAQIRDKLDPHSLGALWLSSCDCRSPLLRHSNSTDGSSLSTHSQQHSSSSAGKRRTTMAFQSTMCADHSLSSQVRPRSPLSPYHPRTNCFLFSSLLLGHILLLPRLRPTHLFLRHQWRNTPPQPLPAAPTSPPLPLLHHNNHLSFSRNHSLLGHPLLRLLVTLHPLVQRLPTRLKLRLRALRTRVLENKPKSVDPPPLAHRHPRLLLRPRIRDLRHQALLRLLIPQSQPTGPRGDQRRQVEPRRGRQGRGRRLRVRDRGGDNSYLLCE